jgi:chitin synthase
MWKLIHSMEENHQIGGVCGEIAARSPRFSNFIESAQHFEYKISHVLDKGERRVVAIDSGRCAKLSNIVPTTAMESVFGYVSVLPGAFSAYRWEAIKGEPLRSYFFIETHSMVDTGPLMANMYLAEDRVRFLGAQIVED